MHVRRLVVALALAFALPVPQSATAAPECRGTAPSTWELASEWCDGVHPGMLVLVPQPAAKEKLCATGFMYADPAGRRYLSMQGSCVLTVACKEQQIVPLVPGHEPLPVSTEPVEQLAGEVADVLDLCLMPAGGTGPGEPVHAKSGPIIRDETGVRIGTLAYAVNEGGVNFALIRLDPGIQSSPAVPHWGGPTKLQPVMPGEAQRVFVYGAMSRYEPNPTYNARIGVAPSGFSSPTIVSIVNYYRSGEAGILVLSEEGAAVGSSPSFSSAFRPQAGLARAAAKAKLNLKLMTAPRKSP